MGFFDDLALTRRIVREDADAIVLEWNRGRDAFLAGAATVLGAPLLAVGVSVLRSEGPGFFPGWIAAAVGAPVVLLAASRLPGTLRRDRIEVERSAARIRIGGPEADTFSFGEVARVQTRHRASQINVLLLELHGRAPAALLEGRSSVLNRVGATIAMWCGVAHEIRHD